MPVTIVQIAQEIYDDLEDENLSIPSISTWLRANVGNLNVNIATSFSINENDLSISPEISIDAKAIFKQMYFCRYYKRRADSVLNNALTNNILSLKDDVSSVNFVNKSELSKTYKSIADSECQKLATMTDLYKRNRALPKDTGC